VPIRELLDFYGRDGKPLKQHDSFYGQSWALFHYLMFEPGRSGQLTKYKTLLATGDTALEAAEGAFGDLDQLDRDVTRYLDRKRMVHVRIQRTALAVGPIAVRKLPEGEAEMVPTRLRSRVGVSREEALALVPEARRIAAEYPDEPAVLAELAEAEFDSGNFDAAIAAADRAIALDPRQVDAFIQKGYALSRKIKDGALPKDAWKDVRMQFVKANKIEPDHPIPLVNFYTAYLAQGLPPTKNSIDGLEWAMQLAPFDGSLRWMVAQQMIRDERLAEAASTLAPLAYSPHPDDQTAAAQTLLREVEQRITDSAKTAAN
jgi:tetratricopeptide (TPR) repeat protein